LPLFGPPSVEKLKAKGDVPGLIRALGQDKNRDVRKTAAVALGQLGDSRAVGPLIAALKDQDKDVGRAAAAALGQISDPRAIEPLVAALSDYYLDEAAAGALGLIGADAVEPLIAALEDQKPGVCGNAAAALGRIGDPRAVEPLIAALENQNAGAPIPAAVALGRIGDPRGVGPLIAALGARHEGVRKAASGALGRMGSPAVEPLVAALKDPNKAVRAAAAAALESLGWQADTAEAGALYCATKGEWGKCVEIGGPSVKPLILRLTSSSWAERKAAAQALVAIWQTGKLGPAERKALLAKRDTIMRGHEDRHVDTRYDDYDEDEGIGVDFPLWPHSPSRE
jgi:HEAT repeat protein